MLRVVGIAFILLSFLTVVPLLLGPFGLMHLDDSTTVWILYPILLFTGIIVAAIGMDSVGTLYRVVGGLQLALASVAALGLVAEVLQIIKFENKSHSLWYVLALGLLLGVLGTTIKVEDRLS